MIILFFYISPSLTIFLFSECLKKYKTPIIQKIKVNTISNPIIKSKIPKIIRILLYKN